MNNFRNLEAFEVHQEQPAVRMHVFSSPTDKRWYLFSIALLVAGLIIRQPLLVIVGVLLLLALAMIDIWAVNCLRNLTYQRSLSQRKALFGEEVTLSLQIENAKILPLPWLEVEDVMPRALPLKNQHLRIGARNNQLMLESLFSVRWYERVIRTYTLQCKTRGVHTFGPTRLRSGDVFGFITREVELEYYQRILVYPLIVPLRSFNLPARHPFGERRAPQRLLEDPSRTVGVREYVYGDSLRRVNWKATARTLTLQSKVYESTVTYTLALFLNVSSRLDAHYSIYPELLELAICATASITDWAMNEGYAVGLYTNTMLALDDSSNSSQPQEEQPGPKRRPHIRLPASSSEEQRRRIIETLARIQLIFSTAIEEVLQAEYTRLPVGATVVIITSTLSEQIIDTLIRLRQHGHAVTVLYVGDNELPLKLAGIKLYHLGGTQTWLDLMEAQDRAFTL